MDDKNVIIETLIDNMKTHIREFQNHNKSPPIMTEKDR